MLGLIIDLRVCAGRRLGDRPGEKGVELVCLLRYEADAAWALIAASLGSAGS